MVKATRKPNSVETKNPGDFYWLNGANKHIAFCCPCGCGDRRVIPVTGPKAWQWNGNEDCPTLTPSILYLDGCKWHGFLTNGEFQQC